MNLFEIYEAALDNAANNEIVLDVEYIQDYVGVALDAHIPVQMAQMIVDAHIAWLDSERGPHNYYVLVESVLEDHNVVAP